METTTQKPAVKVVLTPYRIINQFSIGGNKPEQEIAMAMKVGEPVELWVSNTTKTVYSLALHYGHAALSVNFKPEGSPFTYHEKVEHSFFSGRSHLSVKFKRSGKKQQLAAFLKHIELMIQDVCARWGVVADEVTVVLSKHCISEFVVDCPLPADASQETADLLRASLQEKKAVLA